MSASRTEQSPARLLNYNAKRPTVKKSPAPALQHGAHQPRDSADRCNPVRETTGMACAVGDT